ncbi:MAG: holo-[acyl-carrier-protein] synthase [Chloroflexi bacterium]|nr:holo-[acyl-carrier-protein] synthase [Chloroflexota bacterium]|tara:strand:- start:30596 stop:30955 length:360 start_codon:yes stop_codon:yes gene_type:complete
MNFKRNQELGIDLVRIERFREKKFTQNKSFYKKIFTDSEITYCENFNDPYPHFAGKFALKEAVQKSINKNMIFRNIETFHKNSKPRIRLKNSKEKYHFITSISHESEYAIAIVLSRKEN